MKTRRLTKTMRNAMVYFLICQSQHFGAGDVDWTHFTRGGKRDHTEEDLEQEEDDDDDEREAENDSNDADEEEGEEDEGEYQHFLSDLLDSYSSTQTKKKHI